MLRKQFVHTFCTALIMTVIPLALIIAILVGTGVLSEDFFGGSKGFVPYPSKRPQMELTPWMEPESMTWPDESGTMPDFESASESETETETESETPYEGPVMQIYSDVSEKLYLKERSRGDFDGQTWSAATPYEPLLNGEYAIQYYPSLAAPTETHYVDIMPIMPGLSVMPYYIAPGNGEDNVTVQSNDVYALNAVGGSFRAYFSMYDGTSLPLAGAALGAYESQYSSYVKEHYLTVDPETREYLLGVIEEQSFYASDEAIIEKVASYVQNAAYYNLKYDKELDKEENAVIAFLEEYKEGVCRHYANVGTLLFRTLGIPARYVEGFAVTTVAGEYVEVNSSRAHAWVEVYIEGFGWRCVEVTGAERSKIRVTFKPANVTYQYDGQEHEAPQEVTVRGFEEYAAAGYTYDFTVSGSRTEPGTTKSTVESVTIYDHEGKDVTHFFDVRADKGNVQIYLAKLVLRSRNITRTYNATPQKGAMTDYYVDYRATAESSGYGGDEAGEAAIRELIGRYGYEFAITGQSYTKVGSTLADFSFRILRNAEDCSDHFLVTKMRGTFTIERAPLILVADSAEGKYGTYTEENPLKADPLTGVWFTFGTNKDGVLCDLLEGDRIQDHEIIFVGKIYMPGDQANTITEVIIRDADGADVTSNYNIEFVAGNLTILPPW